MSFVNDTDEGQGDLTTCAGNVQSGLFPNSQAAVRNSYEFENVGPGSAAP